MNEGSTWCLMAAYAFSIMRTQSVPLPPYRCASDLTSFPAGSFPLRYLTGTVLATLTYTGSPDKSKNLTTTVLPSSFILFLISEGSQSRIALIADIRKQSPKSPCVTSDILGSPANNGMLVTFSLSSWPITPSSYVLPEVLLVMGESSLVVFSK